MDVNDISIVYLETIATALGDLLSRVTFVGGSITVLLVDEAGRYGVRKTDDVDVIIDEVLRPAVPIIEEESYRSVE